VLPQAHGQDGRRNGAGPLALPRLLRIAAPIVDELGAGLAAAAEQHRPETILVSTMAAPLAYQVAEAHGLPLINAFLQPVLPTGDFGPVLLGGRSLGRTLNRGIAAATLTASRTLYAGPVRRLRRALGLPREPVRRTAARQQDGRYPTIHGFSTAVIPRPTDWPAHLSVAGYWWPARPADWTPPPDLVDFLAAGPRPVFIGFGSMATGHGGRLAAPILAAVRAARVRAVVQTGWSGLQIHDEDVLSIGEVPHDWLFPQVAAVVHHAGAGTTAAGLRAGVPAVAVPVLTDQPFWAHRLAALGAAPVPLPLPRLTADRLAAALSAVTRAPRYRTAAQTIAARLAAEDGAGPVLRRLVG
jgi:UDP:flavonoid glycosyltransferase YjiC (YdhE family)